LLSDFVQCGQLLTCVVLPQRKHGVQLSLRGVHVNAGLTRDELRRGMLLSGCVASVTDRGYLVETGIEGGDAFIARNDDDDAAAGDNNNERLRVGQPISGVLLDVPERGRLQMAINGSVALTAPSSSSSSSSVPLRSLRAGARVSARVTAHVDNGIVVSFLGYLAGTISTEHLKGKNPPPIGKSVISDYLAAAVVVR
jgi:ribosomal protein S1